MGSNPAAPGRALPLGLSGRSPHRQVHMAIAWSKSRSRSVGPIYGLGEDNSASVQLVSRAVYKGVDKY